MLGRISLVVLVAGLACPAAASTGGFATVGLHSLPQCTQPDEPWTAEFTVLAHGRTPAVGAKPAVIVSHAGGEPGVYCSEVVFPSRGRFEYSATPSRR